MSILDLSKLHMYSFYCDVLKEKYNENIRLVYTDTDIVSLSILKLKMYMMTSMKSTTRWILVDMIRVINVMTQPTRRY